jgi:hypothetical protein
VSPLVHASVALILFTALTPFFGPAAGALASTMLYFGREGAEAQWATRRPKADTMWLSVTPWAWPRQMQLDAGVPAAVMLAAWLVVRWAG